jgi:glycosyltransferase involved in cell wall biosynthesis
MTELLSVVILAHGHGSLLPAAVQSVLDQGQAELEVLVVEHEPSAVVEELAERHAPVAIHQVPSGGNTPGAARNAGVSAASGSLLAFLDADDLWPPGRVTAALAELEADRELDAVFGRVRAFTDRDGHPIADPAEALRDADPPQAARLVTAALFRSESVERVGRFDEGAVLGSEIEWVARAEDAGLRFGFLEGVVLLRRNHAGNTTRTQRDDYGEYARALKRVIDRRRGRE